MKRACLAAALFLTTAAAVSGSGQRAVYRASGKDARLFAKYDDNGYSLDVTARGDSTIRLAVRVSDGPLSSAAPFPPPPGTRSVLPPAAERDSAALRLVSGSRTQEHAVKRVLAGIAGAIRYDPDRSRSQDPGSVFATGRAYCIGFAELAVDLLGRAGISARTVQGILRAEPGSEGYDPAIGGAYHRWIEVYYADRGYVFSDPRSSINGVDARYIPFAARTLVRPSDLSLTRIAFEGNLSYVFLHAGEALIRFRRDR